MPFIPPLIPLVFPSIVFAGLWTALLTFREVSMALLLTETENTVLSVAIWRLWSDGQVCLASAGAVIMVGIMGALLMLALALSKGRLSPQRTGGL